MNTKIIDGENSYRNERGHEYQLIKEGHLSRFSLSNRLNNLSPSLLKQTLTQKGQKIGFEPMKVRNNEVSR